MSADLINKSIVKLESFIQSTRDSGYKGTSSAIAELIDNSLEADAKTVQILVEHEDFSKEDNINIRVIDDGHGMTKNELTLALQFGGSTRFGSRSGMGRYGMGLPNSSVSQAKRLDVMTWRKSQQYLWSHLDVDEISRGEQIDIPIVEPRKSLLIDRPIDINQGTHIWWRNCDRLSAKSVKILIKQLHKDIGRIYRRILNENIAISINGQNVLGYDPLFQMKGLNKKGAKTYGKELVFEIMSKNIKNKGPHKVSVRFVELPVEKWHTLTNQEKKKFNITKRAGISILRNKREIDYGWYFFGNKRKENYDDWWRCELNFEPDLDEEFGVTHNKQGINPSKYIKDILSPDLERIALDLSKRVRDRFKNLNLNSVKPASILKVNIRDKIYPSPALISDYGDRNSSAKGHIGIDGIKFNLGYKNIFSPEVFQYIKSDDSLDININIDHPFYKFLLHPLVNIKINSRFSFANYLELLIISLARAETHTFDETEKSYLDRYRNKWGDLFTAYVL
ncbi:MAG: hypothetical protein HOK52_13640 [Candidatus Marinimicrobia bacterium]|nr:hypothetical protein [Candidatus Neomarinimicrobiota bacterium]